MTFSIQMSRAAVKSLSALPRKEQIRLRDRIDALSTIPKPPDVKKIQGDENLFRIRSGNYRILYRIYEKELFILVIDVDHRKDIYKFL